MTPTDRLLALMERAGAERYGMEAVSQLQHARQCADHALKSGAPDSLVIAAFLHDIGHVVDERAEVAAKRGIDRRHEEIGAGFLSRWFGPEVTEPIRLHVAAKRYLCAVDDDYHATLSPASVHSLQLQGGIFSPQEAEAFIGQPHAPAAVSLRRWDDLAKDPQAEGLTLDQMRPRVAALMRI